ncbi:MAG: phosphoenolpyruvate synthase [Chitinophagales bacterium]|nr:phosphoenolpyruvate synthase [Chitinophagales bacterium]MDW8393529.1 phosphoenolpyruvate synthase [Chitinophagales bacterium]
MQFIRFFSKLTLSDLSIVGGKNASLGELFAHLAAAGIRVPEGFALTAEAYYHFLNTSNLQEPLSQILKQLDTVSYGNLTSIGHQARSLIQAASLPESIRNELILAYRQLSERYGCDAVDVAVRSSATAEDLPQASFAGRMESFLNVRGEEKLLAAVHRCFASLYTDRAIKYRNDMGLADLNVAISVGIQKMVRSDLAGAGVAFTVEPDSGHPLFVVINACWGLGENIVQGAVTPDEWLLFKPHLDEPSAHPVIRMRCGRKELTMRYSQQEEAGQGIQATINEPTPLQRQQQFVLSLPEVIQLAKWCRLIEQHYGRPMDIEWAKDGIDGQLYIVQARPETVSQRRSPMIQKVYRLKQHGPLLAVGIPLGEAIVSGPACLLGSPEEGHRLEPGQILVTDSTNPDWDPVLRRAAAIVTNKGGRTSHAAIVARELGTLAVVGCGNATGKVSDGQYITVSCAEASEGRVYDGQASWEVEEHDFSDLPMPQTAPMFILSEPSRAFTLSRITNQGVGLMRMEFTIANSIQVHPMALLFPQRVADEQERARIEQLTSGYSDGADYFVNRMAEAVGLVAASFYPKPVMVRFSDFKSNEYRQLLGGRFFEPEEENPMIGLRGASRYYSPAYREAFALECAAINKVRAEMLLKNVRVMIPFCRTVQEATQVLAEMEKNGLRRGDNSLEVYVMIELPSNVLHAKDLARLFDGFSIGSNDLTQLTLGLDRDSALVSHLFNEEDVAVKELIARTIEQAHEAGIPVGLCGQAPSDLPEFAGYLVQLGIDSISFNPDAYLNGLKNIVEAEKRFRPKPTEP